MVKIISKQNNTDNLSGQKASKMKGFSLVELMAAMFIFVVIILATVSAFASTFSARKNARDVQKNLEEARTIMETMAKSIRMSQNAHPNDSKTIVLFTQGSCLTYSFTGDKITKSVTYPPDSSEGDSDHPKCELKATSIEMTPIKVEGGFIVDKTDATALPPKIGRVTIRMKVGSGASAPNLQTTVAARDYQNFFYSE